MRRSFVSVPRGSLAPALGPVKMSACMEASRDMSFPTGDLPRRSRTGWRALTSLMVPSFSTCDKAQGLPVAGNLKL